MRKMTSVKNPINIFTKKLVLGKFYLHVIMIVKKL